MPRRHPRVVFFDPLSNEVSLIMLRKSALLIVPTILWAMTLASAEPPLSQKNLPTSEPAIAGDWTGVWGPFNPAKAQEIDKTKCKVLDCHVVRSATGWQATFEGECGRPYKYTIEMEGRQSGGCVLFKGSPDLGEKDGGVHDWIGRAKEGEFIGFYSNEHHTGVFHLARKVTKNNPASPTDSIPETK